MCTLQFDALSDFALGKGVGKVVLMLDDDKAGLAAITRICTKVYHGSSDILSFVCTYVEYFVRAERAHNAF